MDPDSEEKFRKAGKIAAQARRFGAEQVKAGATFLEVAEKVEGFVRSKGAEPAFPVNLALNEVAAHFTPAHNNKEVFQQGDIVKLDVGVHLDGHIGDTAITVEVGTRNWTDLLKAAREALQVAVELIGPGVPVRNIGAAIARSIEEYGYRPIENLTGHSIEPYKLHGGASIPNVMDENKAIVRPGQVFAIEPFATNGTGRVDGKRPSNIYQFQQLKTVRNKDTQNLLNWIEEKFSTLPFSERWCHPHYRKAQFHLKKLLRLQAIRSYPQLDEIGGGIVSQAEHTVLIHEDHAEILTVEN